MARIPICNYVDCDGIRCRSVGTHAIPVAKRGGRNAFFCDMHANRHAMEGYGDENHQRRGIEKVNGFTFSMENETSFSSPIARMELIDVGYVPTHDGTVDIEYKSPIYEGLNALSKHCATFDRLIANDEMRIGYECGSHFHVGHRDHINRETMDYVRRFYHSLFVPLCREMIEQGSEKTAKFWGRDFSSWATPITIASPAMTHTNFINTEHNPTIEFRLCKFRNATQYMQVVKFCRDVVNAIINNFILHFNDNVENITEYRKHKAQIAGEKIVKLYRKYTANL